MDSESRYDIRTDVRFGALELIDVQGLADACREEWFNQTLCRVNDCVVRIGIIKGEFHWHKHDEEDEYFQVMEGRLLVDLEDKSVELSPGQAFVVPKGVVHRTRAPERTVILMVERGSVRPTGD
jgi:dTDP-4-dehydrorhamnose 3,5-epimerase-like enzyme